MKFKNLLITGIIACFSIAAYSQMACSSAVTLTPGSQQCGTNSFAGDFDDASGTPTNPCNSLYNDGEYWFEYTGIGQGLQLDVTGLTATYSGLFVLDDCPSGSPTCIASYTSGSSTADFTLNTPGLTNGTTYYIVLANWSAPYSTDFCLDATVVAPPVPPANDDCSGAIALTVNADLNCGTVTSGTVELSSGSADPTAETCGGTADDDVWYSFVATGAQHQVSLTNISGSTTDMYHSVFGEGMAGCPGLGTQIVCNDGNTSNLSGLTIGGTYYIRVYTWTSTSGQTSTFDVCVGTPPPPPPHDECTGAIALTVNASGSCASTTTSYATSATNSGVASCTGTPDDDVWFTFVAPSSESIEITLSNVTGTSTDMGHEVFSSGGGGGCGLTSLSCSDPDVSTTTGLTAGDTYYVRVYTWGSTASNYGFDICATAGPEPAVTCYDITDPGYSPFPFTGTATAPPDDTHGALEPIGFNFCFMGTEYSNYVISTNGYITFNAGAAGNTFTDYTPEAIPTTSADVLNSIMGPWHDVDPNKGGEIRYSTFGASPNTKLVVSFKNNPLFSTSCTNDPQLTQIVIYETSNVIDLNFEVKTSCATNTDGGRATAGLNGPLGISGVPVPGWNNTVWDADINAGTEATVRFTPSAGCDVCPVPLNYEFAYFDANNKGGINEVMWGTAHEKDVSHFEIQRATDAVTYKTIGIVQSVNENSDMETPYAYIDKYPKAGVNYYRVKRIAKDNKYAFTGMKMVNVDLLNRPNIYPNPASEVVYVEFENNNSNENLNFKLFDITGKLVVTHESNNSKGFNKKSINVSDLNSGVYFYETIINGNLESGKLLIR